MAWLNWQKLNVAVRSSGYNNNVCTNAAQLSAMVENFDDIFDSLSNFTSEISSIRVYPFTIKMVDGTQNNVLSTARGATNILAGKIDYDSAYINLGEVYIKASFGNFADYKGYTHIKAFLPFLGFVDIDTNECMGKYLQFRLFIDFFTGKGLYSIGVSDRSITAENAPYAEFYEDSSIRVISTFECDLGIEIPLGSSNISDIKRNLLLGAVKVAGSTMMASASVKHSMTPNISSNTTTEAYEMYGRGTEKGSRFKKLESSTATRTTTSVHNKPVNVLRPISEAFDGSIDVLNKSYPNGNTDRVNDAGLMWNLSPDVFVQIYRPKMLPVDNSYNRLFGKPLGEVRKLGDLSGYTVITNVHFDDSGFKNATQKEIAMLEEAFANGIIL